MMDLNNLPDMLTELDQTTDLLEAVVGEVGVVFDPDLPASRYVNPFTRQPVFDRRTAGQIDLLMGQARLLGVDLDSLSLAVLYNEGMIQAEA